LARVYFALSVVVLILSFMQTEVSHGQNVLTQHNDLSRSGSNPNETILTTTNVTESTFGKLFSIAIDGFTYAQPLYYKGVTISGGTHNVLYVATAHDSVYAFDADSGTEYWHVSLGTPVPSSVINTQNILVEVGIISTPVIDPTTGTIYVVAKTYTNSVQGFSLHALNISTGAEKFGGPVQISASIAGTGMQSSGGNIPFVASQENQRPALTLVNGVVYLAFASHEDYTPYHGWLLGYSASTLAQVRVFNVTPDSGQGAIWMGGQGAVVDSSNNLYVISGNSTQSTENATADYGESFIKLAPGSGTSMTVSDYFKPNDYDNLNANDTDLGSGGAFAIPGTAYIAGGGKAGVIYVVNTANMGKLDTSKDQVVQEFQAENGIWGAPAFWNDTMYIWGVNEPLKAYHFNGSTFSTTPTSESAYSTPSGTTSGTVSVSSNGTASGSAIVWATAPTADPDHATVGGNMYAYNATNLATLLWSTSSNASRDGYGNYAKYVAPTVANGKVYVGTDSKQVVVYGLLSSGTNLIANGTYVIKSVYSGLAIDDPGSSKTDGEDMQQYTINDGTNQQWTVNNLGGNVITLTNVASGQLLDVAGASKANSALVDQYPANGKTNQQWNVISVGSGNFELTSVNSGLALDVDGGVKTVGAKIDQYTYNANAWQQWSFVSP
jgi:hypothetical protein